MEDGGLGVLTAVPERGRERPRRHQAYHIEKRQLNMRLPKELTDIVEREAERRETTVTIVVRNILARHYGKPNLITDTPNA